MNHIKKFRDDSTEYMKRFTNHGTEYMNRFTNHSMRYINKITQHLSQEVMVILTTIVFVFFIYFYATIVYYWYFYKYATCMEYIYEVPGKDASNNKKKYITFQTPDGRKYVQEQKTDDKNVQIIYYNKIEPSDYIITQTHPALQVLPLILLSVSAFLLLLFLIGTYVKWGVFYFIIIVITNTICIFAYITYIMNRFKKASNWTYVLRTQTITTETTRKFLTWTNNQNVIENMIPVIVDDIQDTDLDSGNIYFSYNTVNGENVITHVTYNKYDISEYNLYYDVTDIQNNIILPKDYNAPFVFPLLITIALIVVLISMCTLFLFL